MIPNTPEAELKAEKINQQVAAWCLNYWMESNPGGAAFYHKLANCAFSQVLLHKVHECSWDSATQTVTSPSGQSDTAAIAEFESQDWLQDILKADAPSTKGTTKAYATPNVHSPLRTIFSLGQSMERTLLSLLRFLRQRSRRLPTPLAIRLQQLRS